MSPTTAAVDPMLIFDRDVLRQRRERAARAWDGHAFLKRELAQRLTERLDDVRRDFPLALDLGCHGGEVGETLIRADGSRRAGIEHLIESDLAFGFARRARAQGSSIVADEEALPFAPGVFDLVLSAMSLHWVNDLPGTLLQIRRLLKPDGLFLTALLGGETLWQLRQALAQAESDVEGGLSPRVSPFVDLREGAGLLQRAGFALPVADSERIEVSYPNAFALMKELAAMGESNVVRGRRTAFSRRATLLRAAEAYGEQHAADDGRVTVTFETIFLHGWSPHDSQQQPMRPGTARHRLADALGTLEIPAGEKAGRTP
jgi:NADH dehydrogenase [ubiquinone] 1 alpha subcomplex assembly factor 5